MSSSFNRAAKHHHQHHHQQQQALAQRLVESDTSLVSWFCLVAQLLLLYADVLRQSLLSSTHSLCGLPTLFFPSTIPKTQWFVLSSFDCHSFCICVQTVAVFSASLPGADSCLSTRFLIPTPSYSHNLSVTFSFKCQYLSFGFLLHAYSMLLNMPVFTLIKFCLQVGWCAFPQLLKWHQSIAYEYHTDVCAIGWLASRLLSEIHLYTLCPIKMIP